MNSPIYKEKTLAQLIIFCFVAGGLALLAFSCSDANNTNTAMQEGNEFFQSYCVICHGKYADGRGSMANRLNTPPMDLTTIAKRRGGNFPDEEIFKIIAGVEDMPGHSSGEMPAWWETLKKSEDITKDKVVKEKIEHIVAYLKAIQK